MLGIDSLMRYTCPQFRHIILPSLTFVFSQNGAPKGLTSSRIECNNRSSSSSFSGDRFSGFSWGRLVFPSYSSQFVSRRENQLPRLMSEQELANLL